jgi:hypothetical protein
VVEAVGSESDSKVCFLPISRDDYERREFAAAVARAKSRPPEPAVPEQTGAWPMTLEDYLRRELAYYRHFDDWLGVWGLAFLGSLVGLSLILVLLDRTGVLSGGVCAVIAMVFMFSALPGVVIFDRIATRKLSARYGLVCPHCQQPCVAPKCRLPGQLIDVTVCRHCGGAVVAPQRADAAGRGPDAASSEFPVS